MRLAEPARHRLGLCAGARRTARARVLLDQPGQGRHQLVDVALTLGEDGGAVGGSGAGKATCLEDERLFFRRERVAGLGLGQLGDGTPMSRLATSGSGTASWSLPALQYSLADALVLARLAFQTWASPLQRAGADAQVGQLADVGVRGGRKRTPLAGRRRPP